MNDSPAMATLLTAAGVSMGVAPGATIRAIGALAFAESPPHDDSSIHTERYSFYADCSGSGIRRLPRPTAALCRMVPTQPACRAATHYPPSSWPVTTPPLRPQSLPTDVRAKLPDARQRRS